MKLIRFFNPNKKPSLGDPKPMKSLLPEWYKESESTFENGDGQTLAGLKRCAPFLDALISGYCLVTPFDIFVSFNKDGLLDIKWNGPASYGDFVMERPKESGSRMPRPAGHLENHLVWSGYWGMKAPKGWSFLVTHPLSRFDLPFTTSSGIIDSDAYSSPGNLPFFIKEGFTGVIPAGTPYLQIIPIKRSSWKMVIDNGLVDNEIYENDGIRRPGKSYKSRYWKRKSYN